ncbi:MAG: asparagine synthase (glutamine-hydrolyzing) [Verrucomicrobia bacterium RIFCSPHIGHO2_12_FULL_41_10]|nr:MAG: asparagine synthase (glutamine-hydrolyzing) [Verrucomicrobia bacterium RIFCSPHIGHO2_12_FULL_41_10]
MCGLAGFLTANHDAENRAKIITQMTNRLRQRGPDDAGIWLNQDDGIALGHRRLAIIDLSLAGHQPMQSHDCRYVIVYNGEIYNFLELKKELQSKSHAFSGHSDTEVILTLIIEYGLEAALKRMRGMFAFALWDKKEKTLHLARDRIGEKPLYYGLVNGSFVFASELKAIRAYPDFHNPINRTSLALFLQYGYVPTPHSIFKNIYKLTPGSYLSISSSKASIKALPKPKIYWSASQIAADGIANSLCLTDKEAIQQADGLLNSVIKNQMIADVPIGAFLSGGIDSSVVAAIMQANSARPIQTFTIGFNDKNYNEAHYAKAVAQHLKTNHTELYVDAQQAMRIIPQLPMIYDEPFADSSAIPTFLVAQLTKQHVTVSLSGDGGDELFGGYNRYLLGKTLWKKIALLPYPVRLIIRKLLLSISPAHWQQLLKLMKLPNIGDKLHKFAAVLDAKSPELFYQQLISQWHNSHDIVNQTVAMIGLSTTLFQQFEAMDFIEKMMITDTLSYLPDDIMVKVDRATMAVSLESRAPYLDHQLIEWMWQLPLHMKVRNSTTKWLLRQVLAQYVPIDLFDRPKMGFAVPLDAWLRGPLRDWAENLLNKKHLKQQGFLQAEPILEKWQEHLSGKRNWQHPLWTVIMFQAWINQ